MKNEQRIKVGHNSAEEYQHQKDSNLKLEILQNAIIEFKKLSNSDVEDLGTFELGFFEYFLFHIKNKHKAAAVLGLSDQEFCRMFQYDLEQLQQLEAQYNTQSGSIKIFKNIASLDDSLDFGIYCENEREVEKYEAVTELIKAATNIYDRYFVGQIPIQSMKFMPRLFILNSDATELVVNPNFIKNE